jgi:HlyD family secretion protein
MSTDLSAAPRAPRRTHNPWVRRVVVAGVLVAVGAGVVSALRPKPISVELGAVTRGPLRVTIDEPGFARVADRYVVYAPQRGALSRISLRPGDHIARGALIARLLALPTAVMDPRERAEARARVDAAQDTLRQLRSAAERARLAREFAERHLARTRALAQQGAVAAAELDRAEADLRGLRADESTAHAGAESAVHQVELARAALGINPPAAQEELQVRAPVSGVVLRVGRESEGAVNAGQELLEIGDPSALEAVVEVLTSDAVRVREGAEVTLERWGGEHPLRGTVRRVEPSAFTRTSALGVEERRVNVLVSPTDPRAWSALGDGYRVEARITVWQRPDATHAPSSAVFRRGEGWGVYAVRGGTARFEAVEVGERAGADVELRRGPSPGTPVVMHPGDAVRDGVAVRDDAAAR